MEQQVRGGAVAFEKDKGTLHPQPRGPGLSNTTSQNIHLIAVSTGKKFQSMSPAPLTQSLPSLVLGLKSYQTTESYEEKDLEGAMTLVTVNLPPGFLCFCPNLKPAPRPVPSLWLLQMFSLPGHYFLSLYLMPYHHPTCLAYPQPSGLRLEAKPPSRNLPETKPEAPSA